MTMPRHLILVRHGESEGNVAARAARAGDTSAFTDSFVTIPGHQWNLTPRGVGQARASGAWLREEFAPGGSLHGAHIDRAYVSPYVRTCQTAGHLGAVLDTSGHLAEQLVWFKNRAIRERDWGDIGTMPTQEFRAKYVDNARQRDRDPLYWVPPGGESLAHVAEDRVRNFLDTLHREATDTVLAVTHGEFMFATRLVLERVDDSGFLDLVQGPERAANGEIRHYTRINPEPGPHQGEEARSLRWVRRMAPVETDGAWTLEASSWRRIEFAGYTSEDLIEGNSGSVPR